MIERRTVSGKINCHLFSLKTTPLNSLVESFLASLFLNTFLAVSKVIRVFFRTKHEFDDDSSFSIE